MKITESKKEKTKGLSTQEKTMQPKMKNRERSKCVPLQLEVAIIQIDWECPFRSINRQG